MKNYRENSRLQLMLSSSKEDFFFLVEDRCVRNKLLYSRASMRTDLSQVHSCSFGEGFGVPTESISCLPGLLLLGRMGLQSFICLPQALVHFPASQVTLLIQQMPGWEKLHQTLGPFLGAALSLEY